MIKDISTLFKVLKRVQPLARLAMRATTVMSTQSTALLANPVTTAAMPRTSAWSAPRERTTPKGAKASALHAQAKHIRGWSLLFASFAWKGKQELHACSISCDIRIWSWPLCIRHPWRKWATKVTSQNFTSPLHIFCVCLLKVLLRRRRGLRAMSSWYNMWHWRRLYARENHGGWRLLAYSFQEHWNS